MPGVTICTLTGFEDLFDGFADSVDLWETSPKRVAITSRGVRIRPRPGWFIVPGPEPFVFARNANLALRLSLWDHTDFLLVNDDVRLKGPICDSLAEMLAAHPKLGIVAPLVDGGTGNRLQIADCPSRPAGRLVVSEERIPFICVLIRRAMLLQIGILDEIFTGYGGDDTDYCQRAQKAGWTIGFDTSVVVEHGVGVLPYRSSSSFLRTMTARERARSMAEMDARLEEKKRAALGG